MLNNVQQVTLETELFNSVHRIQKESIKFLLIGIVIYFLLVFYEVHRLLYDGELKWAIRLPIYLFVMPYTLGMFIALPIKNIVKFTRMVKRYELDAQNRLLTITTINNKIIVCKGNANIQDAELRYDNHTYLAKLLLVHNTKYYLLVKKL